MADRVPYELILEHWQKGTVRPFLGAAGCKVGRDATWVRGKGLPDGTELALELARLVGYDGPMDLRKVAQYAEITGMESAFGEMLREIVGAECDPNELHNLLAEMSANANLSVTTNYDTLLERAMGTRPYDVVIPSPRKEWGVKYFGWLPHDRGW